MARLSIKAKIAAKQAQKSVEDRVYEAFSGFSEAEESEVKKVLIDLFELNSAAKDVAVEEAPAKTKYNFAKKVEKAPKAEKVAEKPAANRRGRKPGSKNRPKDGAGVAAAAPAAKKTEKVARGRKGSHATLHEDKLLADISNILRSSTTELSLKEIREELFKNGYEEHRTNKSFQPRLSGLLNKWCKAGLMKKPAHGVYILA